MIILGYVGYAIHLTKAKCRRRRVLAELGTPPVVMKDFTTPEGAILCLEATYPQNDIEAAVACHDFETDARLHLRKIGVEGEVLQQMLPKITEVIEASYRKSQETYGLPSGWDKAVSYFVKREPVGEGLVVVSKVTVGPDGSVLRQRIMVSNTPNGWRVVSVTE